MSISSKRRQQAALAATAVTAVAIAVVTPAQSAAADPTTAASAAVRDHTLVITGTPHADNVQIGVGAAAGTLFVDFGLGGAPLTFDRATFGSIAVFLGSGDDTILGGAGTDLIFGGRGNDTVDGGRGTDTEILGQGDDVAAWDPGEGNDIIDGGRGLDTLTFNGSNGNEKFALAASSSHAVFTRDLGNIRMDLDGVEALHLATLGGVDQVTLHDVHATDLTQAAIDLSTGETGDGQADTVTVEGSAGADHVDVTADGGAVDVTGLALTTRVTGSEGFDQLQVNTGEGNDSVHVSDAVAKLIGVSVDLGPGQIS